MQTRAAAINGTCEVMSQPGKGATVVVTVPRHAA
jgi:signal transduction histidine kinase